MTKKLKVAVIMGGKSPEYEVSIISGGEVVKNLDNNKYIVTPVVISKEGDSAWLGKIKNQDLVFIAMHGRYGEDGTIQGLLETLGVPYTGSGVLASAVGMDKILFRKVMLAEKIPIPKYIVVSKNELLSDIEHLVKSPWFVKPPAQGSSVGASIARNKEELKKSLNLAFKYGETALVDEYIKGREFTCSILGNENPVALPIIEIKPKKSAFFDYASKYTESGAEEIVPAIIPAVLKRMLQEMAIKVHKILGCRGFSRVDFIVEDDGRYVVLETNTIPGLTPASLFPKAAQAAGYTYRQLLDMLIRFSLKNE